MHENSFEKDEELGNDCAILKFPCTKLEKFNSFNHISFFQYFHLGCGALSKRVEEWGCIKLFFWLDCEAPRILDW
jgi:hypothetical protein